MQFSVDLTTHIIQFKTVICILIIYLYNQEEFLEKQRCKYSEMTPIHLEIF